MARRSIAGIDIGSFQVRVVVAQDERRNTGTPKILGAGYAESKGLRHGYIVNSPEATRSIATAAAEAEKSSGTPVRRAYLAVGGVGLDEARGRGETVISRADMEVTDLDVEKVLASAEVRVRDRLLNRKVLHVIPLSFQLDGNPVYGRAVGMKGKKLAGEVLFITCFEQHLEDLIASVEAAGITVEDVMAAPLAASLVTLTKADKKAGCVLANIGSETVSIVVYENGTPISLKVFPIGSAELTHDIALGLKVPLAEAEQIKIGAVTGASFAKKKLDDIIEHRLSGIFKLVDAHLKEIGKSGLLPAGVIITGGASGIATIEDMAKAVLKLPSKRYYPSFSGNAKVKDSSWAVAYGLTIFGFSAEAERASFGTVLSKKITRWLEQFLP